KSAITAVFLTVSLAAPLAAGPLEDATAAYGKGDYPTALRLLRPIADQGLAKAQILLGVMYAMGQGVVQNYDEAMKWYRRAADQRDAAAQAALGGVYAHSLGAPPHETKAKRWCWQGPHAGLATAA